MLNFEKFVANYTFFCLREIGNCRIDMSEEHAAESRASFLSAISVGEGVLDLAEAALHIAAEDDALGEYCH